jgi:crotonobetainyl-CoA:carnitine CoA-transferase CaiB-like acyl-CoA transferase
MERYGLDAATLRAANPGLVYCSISGFGREQGATLAGYDLLVQAVGGLMSITGHPGAEPTKVGVAVVDVLTGLNALSGILLALRERDRTGTGQRVEVDLLTSLLAGLTNQASSTLATGVAPQRLGNAHPSIAPYEVFEASDRELVVAVGNDRQFRSFATILEMPELADDERFATNTSRVAHRHDLRDVINAALAVGTASHWVSACTATGVPAGLVNSVAEAFDFAASLGLDAVAHVSDPATGRIQVQPANPIHLSSGPARYERVAPTLGEHDGAVWLDGVARGAANGDGIDPDAHTAPAATAAPEEP